MEAFWTQRLAERFGRESVVDVLVDTPLEGHATELGFGVFLVPGAVPPSTRMQLHRGMEGMFITVKTKGKKKNTESLLLGASGH